MKDKGITLINLIITIVILLILAGITVNSVANEGIMNKSKNARDKSEEYDKSVIEQLDGISRQWDSEDEISTVKTIDVNTNTIITTPDEEKVPIPTGFVVSKATGENTVSGGLVIYEGTEDVTDDNVEEAKRTRNQFVWVPIDYDEYKNVTGYTDEYDTDSTQESKKIEESIKKYNGFFIGRYETGKSGNSAVVRQGKETYTNLSYENAVQVSKSMYKENDMNYGAASTLIHGRQWDSFVKLVEGKIGNIKYYGNYCTNDGIGRNDEDKDTSFEITTGGSEDTDDNKKFLLSTIRGKIESKYNEGIVDINITMKNTMYYNSGLSSNKAKIEKVVLIGSVNGISVYARIMNNNCFYTDANGNKILGQSQINIGIDDETNYLTVEDTNGNVQNYYKNVLPIDEQITPTLIYNIGINRTKYDKYIKTEIVTETIQATNMSEESIYEAWGINPTFDENKNIIAAQISSLEGLNKAKYNNLLLWDNNYKINKAWYTGSNLGQVLQFKQTANTKETTGYSDSWCINNVYDIAGNVEEMTREYSAEENFVVRGGKYYDER